jgi:hypothetical protein
MTSERRWRPAVCLVGAAFASPSQAHAQVHWDMGAQVGVTDRMALGSAPGRTPGPSGEIHAHVAVYPMLRVGPYAAFDLSPTAGLEARRIYATGARVKITPPWLAAPWRVWGFLGFGVAYAYAPSSPTMPSSSTTMLELPVGVGLSHKLRGAWAVCTELGAWWNVATFEQLPRNAGRDLLAVSLSVGVSLAP